MIENYTKEECGLIQKGIHLKMGKAYCFRLLAGIRGGLSKAGLNGFGERVHNKGEYRITINLGVQQKEFFVTTFPELLQWEFSAQETEVADISIRFDFEGTLILSFASLMPTDNLGGWRSEVVEMLREVAPSVVRFPGGCFVSFYHWESSIGDRDKREPQPSYYWGGLEENDVGLDEFLYLSELVGFEPQIWHGEITNNYDHIFATQQISWNYALNGAHRLLDYISYGGDFGLANFNNMCNTWGQNVIEATKDGCFLSSMGHIFEFFSKVFEPCTAARVNTEEESLLALAVKTASEKNSFMS